MKTLPLGGVFVYQNLAEYCELNLLIFQLKPPAVIKTLLIAINKLIYLPSRHE